MITPESTKSFYTTSLHTADPAIADTIKAEQRRQHEHLELIASENYVSQAVLDALGSCLTNKYAEGYPTKRYYGGCEEVDRAEQAAIDRAHQLFGAEYVNVQPHSGSQANMAVYFATLKPGDTLLALSLDHGGHLSHGHKVNFSGKLYDVVHYGVDRETHLINYDDVASLARQHKPAMIVAGTSAYSRQLDYKAFRRIADEVGALLLADIAHPAGLVAAKKHPDPVPYCDFVTSTTHKTLRGPRGGLIMSTSDHAKKLKSSLFPGIQGGPLMHVIAAKAVAFQEALQPSFQTYCDQVIQNAQALAAALQEAGLTIITGGTDTHVLLVDLTASGITGNDAEVALGKAHMTVNKNMIPFDEQPPMVTSGLRLGTAALTTRGLNTKDMHAIAGWMKRVLHAPDSESTLSQVREEVRTLCDQYPIYA